MEGVTFKDGVLRYYGWQLPVWPKIVYSISASTNRSKALLYSALVENGEPFEEWRKTFPKELVRMVCTLHRSDQLQLMRVYYHAPEKVMLLYKSNPALLTALSFRPSSWDDLHCKQAVLLEHLDFDPRASWARILRKIDTSAACHISAHRVLVWCRTGLDRLLRHVPKINWDIITALEAWDKVPLPALHAMLQYPQVAREISHIIEVRRAKGLPPWPYQNITSIEQIHRAYERVDGLAEGNAQLAVPLDEDPGRIEVIKTLKEVRREAVAMENCLAQYQEGLRIHVYAAYRVLLPQRCSLLLRWCTETMEWDLVDLRAFANAEPAGGTREFVETWLRNGNQRNREGRV